MHTIAPTTISLDASAQSFVQSELASGRFNSINEIIHASLRLLEQQGITAQSGLDALRADITLGLASGPGKPAASVFERLEAKYRQSIEDAVN